MGPHSDAASSLTVGSGDLPGTLASVQTRSYEYLRGSGCQAFKPTCDLGKSGPPSGDRFPEHHQGPSWQFCWDQMLGVTVNCVSGDKASRSLPTTEDVTGPECGVLRPSLLVTIEGLWAEATLAWRVGSRPGLSPEERVGCPGLWGLVAAPTKRSPPPAHLSPLPVQSRPRTPQSSSVPS